MKDKKNIFVSDDKVHIETISKHYRTVFTVSVEDMSGSIRVEGHYYGRDNEPSEDTVAIAPIDSNTVILFL